MTRIKLVYTPFTAVNGPSIALTQMRSVVEARFGDRVEVDIAYANQDFAQVFPSSGLGVSLELPYTGAGDWFFRQIAFPDAEDNAREFLQRFFPRIDSGARERILEARAGLGRFMDSVIDQYELAAADVVGFSSLFSQNVASFAFARKLKERNPDVITVVGGANCEWPMGLEIARNVPQLDFVFSGPALVNFPQFIGHVLDGEIEKCHSLQGVLSASHSDPDGGPQFGAELDIDVDVELDYDSFLESLERKHPGVSPTLFFETSRGCWWGEKAHCTFCGLNGETMGFRFMSPPKAKKLIESLLQRYSGTVSSYLCVDNIMPREYVAEVFPTLEVPEDATIFYEVKSDLKLEDLQVLARAGVTMIQPGIEALDTPTLKLMKKGTSSFQNLALLKNGIRADIHVAWNLLVGFPGEAETALQKYARDLPSLTHLQPPAGVFPVRFDRYSPYFVRAEDYGLDLRPFDFYPFIYPFDDETVSGLAVYFQDQNYFAPYLSNLAEWIGPVREVVRSWQLRWRETAADGERPELALREVDGTKIVHDSRTAKPIEYELDDVDGQILSRLERPLSMQSLHAALSSTEAPEVERRVAVLRGRGLVFEERGRMLNLVLGVERAEAVVPR